MEVSKLPIGDDYRGHSASWLLGQPAVVGLKANS